jgi:mannose-1-phosphate guanylyltransferase
VLAATHVISNTDELQRVVKNSIELAEAGKLVTFGIVPTHAETGYGYIRQGKAVAGFDVAEFFEKPDLDTANSYLVSGDYLWNSGIFMFMFKASCYVEELTKFNPEIIDVCKKALAHTSTDLDFVRVDETEFTQCPDDSIDHTVMEPLCRPEVSGSVVVVPLDAA